VRTSAKEQKPEENERLHDVVAEKLRDNFSPEQSLGRPTEDCPDDPGMRVSHETIVRHEAPGNRVEVRDLRRRSVAAVR
jgi:IS30 family transposase